MNEQHADQEYGLNPPDDRRVAAAVERVSVEPGGYAAQVRRLGQELCELIEADYWVWSVLHDYLPQGQMMPMSLLHNLSDDQMCRLNAAAIEAGARGLDAAMARLMADHGQHLTRLRNQVLPDEQIAAVESYQRFMPGTDLEHSLFSLVPLQTAGQACVLGCHRGHGRPAFTQRDADVTHHLVHRVPWLHRNDAPAQTQADVTRLTPRLRTVLAMLLDGQEPKRIAYHLDIAPDTVRGHIKKLYRHFDVARHSELMRRFMPEDMSPAAVPSTLSPRLRSVFRLLLEGQSTPQVAEALGLSVHTIRGYVKRIYKELGVTSRRELSKRHMNGVSNNGH